MSAAVERVARAVYESHQFVRPWDHPRTRELWHAVCRSEARAAIAALREPDEAMLRAAEASAGLPTSYVWRAMIDAALDAPPAGKEGGYSDAGPEKPVR